VIRLPQTTLDDLRVHQVAQTEQRLSLGSYWKGTEDYVFTNPEGMPLKPDSVSSWFSKFMKQHPEIPFITLHSLRHTNATLQLAAGVPITTVSKRLGHSNTATTGRVYAHAIQSADDLAAEKLDDLFTQQRKKSAAS
jgi:integrase